LGGFSLIHPRIWWASGLHGYSPEVNHSSTLSATSYSMLINGMCRGPSSLCRKNNYTYRLTYVLLTSQFIYLPPRNQYPTWLWPICLPTRSQALQIKLVLKADAVCVCHSLVISRLQCPTNTPHMEHVCRRSIKLLLIQILHLIEKLCASAVAMQNIEYAQLPTISYWTLCPVRTNNYISASNVPTYLYSTRI
jgi:hypothetical protein